MAAAGGKRRNAPQRPGLSFAHRDDA